MDWVIAIIALVALFIVISRIDEKKSNKERVQWEEKENIPDALKGMELFMSEEIIQCDHPLPLRGRVDQVYRSAGGDLCIVDTKHRKNAAVYESDRIQCSVYAFILRANNMPVRNTAYLRISMNDDGVRYIPLKLYEENKIIQIYNRRKEILDNPRISGLAINPGLCRYCGHGELENCKGKT